jgi:hypothetical protein
MESTVELVFTKHFEAQISGKSGFLDLLALESHFSWCFSKDRLVEYPDLSIFRNN